MVRRRGQGTNVTGGHILKLAKLFGLKQTETDYFEAMVHFGQSASLEERNRYFQKMIAFKEVRADLVGMDRLEFYSKWYYGAIRELFFFHPFRGDYAELARRLSPPIRQADARESVALLERLGMVEPNSIGGYKSKEAVLKKDPAFPSVVMANFLKNNIELAIEALDRYSKEERDLLPYGFAFRTGVRPSEGGHPRVAQEDPGYDRGGRGADQGVSMQFPIFPPFALTCA